MPRQHFDLERDPTWSDFYRPWQFERQHNPELEALADFQPIEWPTRYYWGLDQPAELILSDEASIHLDWWPRREVVQRTRHLADQDRAWYSPSPPPPQASRYTLFKLWQAKAHREADEALAAVWIAACLGMWRATLPPAWHGPFVNVLEMAEHVAVSRMHDFDIDSWSRPCRYLLPDSLGPLLRQPTYTREFIDMAVANTVFVLNRWTLVQLLPAPRSPATTPTRPQG